MKKLIATIFMLAGFVPATQAFQLDEFRNGMSKEKLREVLAGWKFDRIQDFSDTTVIAYDQPEKRTFRQYTFTFCNDKLVALQHELKPSLRNFIITSNNYIASNGQPMKVDTNSSVISTGEKSSIALFWRAAGEVVGIKYSILPAEEELAIVYEVPNSCFNIPRSQ